MHYPIKGGKELIVINSHMSAYDKGGKMRKAQMKILSYPEYKATYMSVVTSTTIGRDMLTHFDHQEKIPSWVSVLDQRCCLRISSWLKQLNRERVATVRSTNMKYRPKVNYQTVGDGFIISKILKPRLPISTPIIVMPITIQSD